jgi:hypothetical protein
MSDAGAGLAAQVETLAARLRSLEARVAVLESRPPAQASEAVEAPGSEDAPIRLPVLQGGLTLAGRTLLVLAGAYLVRALVDAGTVPVPLGAALGMAYAAFWQVQAAREGRAGRHASAALHALAANAIAFPLIGEACVRYGLVSAAGAGLAVFAFAAVGLVVSNRQPLAVNAWISLLGACATLVALLAATREPLPALAALLAIAAVVEWQGRHGDRPGQRWLAAAVVDAVALLLLAVATRREPPPGYGPLSASLAALLLAGIPALYTVSVAVRTLVRGEPIGLFLALQSSLAACLGFAGGRLVLLGQGRDGTAPVLLAAAAGVLAYAAAFAHAERRPDGSRNFYFFSTAGGLLVLLASLGLGLGEKVTFLWTTAGLSAVVLGRRFDRVTLRAHGALYLAAAATATDLLPAGLRALIGLPGVAPSPWAWPVALSAAAAWAVLAGDAQPAVASRSARLLVSLVVVAAAAAAVEQAITGPLAGAPNARSVARVAVLVGLVLGLARLSRCGLPELMWLVRPLLAAGGLVLLLELPGSRPATLVACLGLYGGLLTLLPRLLAARGRAD